MTSLIFRDASLLFIFLIGYTILSTASRFRDAPLFGHYNILKLEREGGLCSLGGAVCSQGSPLWGMEGEEEEGTG